MLPRSSHFCAWSQDQSHRGRRLASGLSARTGGAAAPFSTDSHARIASLTLLSNHWIVFLSPSCKEVLARQPNSARAREVSKPRRGWPSGFVASQRSLPSKPTLARFLYPAVLTPTPRGLAELPSCRPGQATTQGTELPQAPTVSECQPTEKPTQPFSGEVLGSNLFGATVGKIGNSIDSLSDLKIAKRSR